MVAVLVKVQPGKQNLCQVGQKRTLIWETSYILRLVELKGKNGETDHKISRKSLLPVALER